jgi:hypothetical protein
MLPTITAIENWDTANLTTAANHWILTAKTWERAFTEISERMPNPGGAPWEGIAASAAERRTYADRLKVIGVADELHSAAAVARKGANELASARQRALSAVADARAAGFTVSDDLSLSCRVPVTATGSAVLLARMQTFAADIRVKASALALLDQQVAGKLNNSALQVSKTSFDRSDTRMLGYGRLDPKEAPPTDALPVRDVDDVHKRVDPLPPGRNRGVKVLPNAAAVEGLYAELTENATPAPSGTYKGEWQTLPDGTKVGFRPDSKSGGPTVEIWNPDGSKMWDVHVGDPPKRSPPIPAPAPAPAPAPVTVPAPEAPLIPDIGGVSPASDLSPVEVEVGGVVVIGVGIVAGVGKLGQWIFSP